MIYDLRFTICLVGLLGALQAFGQERPGGGGSGGGGGTNNFAGKSVFYVETTGNDATAAQGNPAKPWLTYSNALVAAAVNGGGIVKLGSGVFPLLTTVTNMANVQSFGSGRNATLILPDPSLCSGQDQIVIAGDNVTIQDLTLGTNMASGTHYQPIRANSGTNVWIRNCVINGDADAVYGINGFLQMTIADSVINYSWDGARLQGGAQSVSNTLAFYRCTFNNYTNAANTTSHAALLNSTAIFKDCEFHTYNANSTLGTFQTAIYMVNQTGGTAYTVQVEGCLFDLTNNSATRASYSLYNNGGGLQTAVFYNTIPSVPVFGSNVTYSVNYNGAGLTNVLPDINMEVNGVTAQNSAAVNKANLQTLINSLTNNSAGGAILRFSHALPMDNGVQLYYGVKIVGNSISAMHGPSPQGAFATNSIPSEATFLITNTSGGATFTLYGNNAMENICFFYPKQIWLATNPAVLVTYPATIAKAAVDVEGISLRRLTFLGNTKSIDFNTPGSTCELLLIEDCGGYPLGGSMIDINHCNDIARIRGVHVNGNSQRELGYQDWDPAILNYVGSNGAPCISIASADEFQVSGSYAFGTRTFLFITNSYGSVVQCAADMVENGIIYAGQSGTPKILQVSGFSSFLGAGSRTSRNGIRFDGVGGGITVDNLSVMTGANSVMPSSVSDPGGNAMVNVNGSGSQRVQLGANCRTASNSGQFTYWVNNNNASSVVTYPASDQTAVNGQIPSAALILSNMPTSTAAMMVGTDANGKLVLNTVPSSGGGSGPTNFVHASMHSSANQSIGASSLDVMIKVNIDTVDYDPNSMCDTSIHGIRIPVAGYYYITGTCVPTIWESGFFTHRVGLIFGSAGATAGAVYTLGNAISVSQLVYFSTTNTVYLYDGSTAGETIFGASGDSRWEATLSVSQQ